MLDFLEQEHISRDILDGIRAYRARYPLPERLRPRVPHPHYHYYGREIWEAAAAALLCGRNLLLAGSKATGKNVLAENLSMAFDRPAWNVSFHVNMDAASLIGMDTFTGGEVTFRPGPVYLCAQSGGFGILDEINMAKNEALTSRFVVIQMPTIAEDGLERLLSDEFPTLEKKYRGQFAALFLDLQKKCESAEISSKALDLRGLLDALHLMRTGVAPAFALDMGITNKAFDSYEQGLIRDVIATRIPAKLESRRLFTD